MTKEMALRGGPMTKSFPHNSRCMEAISDLTNLALLSDNCKMLASLLYLGWECLL